MELTGHFRKLIAELETRYVAAGVVMLVALLVLSQSPSLQPETDEQLSISLTVDYGDSVDTSIVSVDNGSSAFHVLNSSHTVNYTEYSFGYFVTGIDGVNQNGTHSWLYFVNGEPASKAVDQYRMEEGYNLSFRFVSNNRSQELLG